MIEEEEKRGLYRITVAQMIKEDSAAKKKKKDFERRRRWQKKKKNRTGRASSLREIPDQWMTSVLIIIFLRRVPDQWMMSMLTLIISRRVPDQWIISVQRMQEKERMILLTLNIPRKSMIQVFRRQGCRT